MSEPVEVKSCGVLLVCGTPIRSFLLMKHADRWDLPKGHVDPGETEIECALREMEEETGILRQHVTIDPDFCIRQQYYVQYKRDGGQKKLKELVIFLGTLSEVPDILLTEHLGFQWFDWNPPHHIQEMSIDPVLRAVEQHVASREHST
ncbi:dihydroneopterin triphosphate pyrophosphatase [Thalassoglobus neptunius]|uniref:Bis(5'-nucleosyl)-tetraphosphatase [asymmetrical] n=1 Tax=Thalassoglobus neptunius TaxID=1938619 RepID=A0A5C5VWD9_9PLAN|nr:NUDIX domain-containing protein [Thalassoglobus neptunius]TWT42996.1 dihydroneopterin triphosphate pyrophosphatase [Thalassoglobus neptunius]